MKENQIIRHPVSGATVEGRKLEPDEVIRESDVYASMNGRWESSPVSNGTVPKTSGNNVVWVRPTASAKK